MIDLHSHILPGLCDGSQDLDTSLEMARIAVADGTTHLACTPHIYPSVYENNTSNITEALEHLQKALNEHEIPLTLVIGADTHMVPEVMQGLRKGNIPTLNHTRYFLLEPSHHVPVVGFLDQIENFLNAGYVPLITHPERLRWLENHYDEFIEAAKLGAWIQLTAGAVAGDFGRTAKKWSERFLQDGYVHILASDAHGIERRPPVMSAGINEAINIIGDEIEVLRMVKERPQAVLDNLDPEQVTKPLAFQEHFRPNKKSYKSKSSKKSWFSQLFA